MELSINKILGYSDIFGSEVISYKELLADLPKEKSLEIVSHFLTQLHSKEKNTRLQFELLNFWLKNQGEEVHKVLMEGIVEASEKGGNLSFFNNISFLYTIQKILIHCDHDDREFTYDDELKLFKACLLISDEWLNKSHKLIDESREYKTEEDIIELVLPSQLPIHENILFKDFRIQFLKSIYLFEFLESSEIFSEILEEFISVKNVKDWEEYLVKVLSLYVCDIAPPQTKSKLVINDESVRSLMDTLCINDIAVTDDKDYISLRNHPIYKTSGGL